MPVVLYLAPLTNMEREAAQDLADRLIAQWITGGWMDEDGKWQKEAAIYPPIDDQPIRLSQTTIRLMATIQTMQHPPEGEPVYTVIEDMVVWAAADNYADLWTAVKSMAAEVADKAPGKS